ncbi:uncharacterized protein LOC110406506 isoform X2 [Numida meleagris]|uniref:uncharacterized protein LOC110406506 isoform X2 n=1 Tax=Numida meleagris TaxID=8996 RepID=UPI000B3DC7BE|nr:uncharacterized protein LOC110406506 isoform X2 [Numida meleagris]
MRHNARPLGVLAAVAKGLLLLWAVPTRSAQPPSPQQTQALVRHMAEDAQDLFELYEQEQHLAYNLCRTNSTLEWLRGTLGPRDRDLRALHSAMSRMERELQDIARHQRNLHPPGAAILRHLQSARLKARGLLAHLQDTMEARGLVPATAPPARRPAASRVFQQKLEGCRVLWNYAQFMAKLSARLEARALRARREERGRRRGRRRGQRTTRA